LNIGAQAKLHAQVEVVAEVVAETGIGIVPRTDIILDVQEVTLVTVIALGRRIEGGLTAGPAATAARQVDLNPEVLNPTMKQIQSRIHLFVLWLLR
jgi:hypothetical protein